MLAYFGIGCLLLSALLTAIYMLTIVIRAFFPSIDFDGSGLEGVKDPNWKMLVPLAVFAVMILVFGLCSAPMVRFFGDVAEGVY